MHVQVLGEGRKQAKLFSDFFHPVFFFFFQMDACPKKERVGVQNK